MSCTRTAVRACKARSASAIVAAPRTIFVWITLSVSYSNNGGAMSVMPPTSDSCKNFRALSCKGSPLTTHLMVTLASTHRSGISALSSRHASDGCLPQRPIHPQTAQQRHHITPKLPLPAPPVRAARFHHPAKYPLPTLRVPANCAEVAPQRLLPLPNRAQSLPLAATVR